MYNKEISEKMLSDAFDMMDNIRESKRVCKDIVDRNKMKMNSTEFDCIMEALDVIDELDNKTKKYVAEMLDINGEVRGYNTETYLRLINLYEGIVKSNKEVYDRRNYIREKYM